MTLLPGDPLSLVGLALIAGTIALLVFSDWPRAYLLGVSAIVLFALQFVDQVFLGSALGLAELAFVPANFLAGEWWGIVTHAFLHSSLFHIFGNLFILLTAGPALEDRVGPGWFLAIYAIGGLASAGAGLGLAYVDNAGTVLTLPEPHVAMVGASGAIFAILTAFAVRYPNVKLPIPIILVVWLRSSVVLFIYLAFNVALMFMDVSVAWYGHFGGFLAGLFLAMLPLEPLEEPGSDRVDVATLQSLATSQRGEEALERLSELEPGEHDVATAWLDVLADDADCPVCGDSLEREGLSLRCPHGHSLEGSGEAEP